MKKTIIALALIILCACQKREDAPLQAEAMPVEVTQPVVKEVMLTRKYPGYLDSDATIPIVGRVNGVIKSRNFTDGGRVKKNDLLFVIEPALYEYAAAQAEAALRTAEAELEYAKSNYPRKMFTRISSADNGDGTHTVILDAKDYKGNKITCNWTGVIERD